MASAQRLLWKSINGPIDSVNITQVLLGVSGWFDGSNLILLDRKQGWNK